ncbi:MAG: YdcF family protein [Candidatus Uhrbacteria bacterium]|nr:YdcF family protein [Candidatus Uhrbacteria bacterium]
MIIRTDMAVVVLGTPRYNDAFGVEKIWFGRLHRGIELACYYGCALVVVGDANGGEDNQEFARVAREHGVAEVIISKNGDRREDKTTRGDARASYRAFRDDPKLAGVKQAIYVTCWYHIPRTRLALWRARSEVNGARNVRWAPSAVWRKLRYGVLRLLDFRAGELRGCLDYILDRPQTSRGEPLGKPDHKQAC